MSNFKGWEIVVVLVLLLLLFGAKRLPDAARGLGRSLRIFKAETKGLRDDDRDPDSTDRPDQADARPVAPRELPSSVDDRAADPATRQPVEHPTPER